MSISKNTYPELYFSTIIEQALNAKPELPEKPIEPTPPKKPIDPDEYDSDGNRGCSFVGMVISTILFFIAIDADKYNIRLSLCTLCIFLLSLFIFKGTSLDKKSHEKKKSDFNKALKEYPNLLEKYENDLILAFKCENFL